MFNPLIKSPLEYTDAELSTKITELNKKMTIAMRSGNSRLGNQVQIVINQLVEEQVTRQRKLLADLDKDQNKDWGNSIDIS